jgi:hypothetical protein
MIEVQGSPYWRFGFRCFGYYSAKVQEIRLPA